MYAARPPPILVRPIQANTLARLPIGTGRMVPPSAKLVRHCISNCRSQKPSPRRKPGSSGPAEWHSPGQQSPGIRNCSNIPDEVPKPNPEWLGRSQGSLRRLQVGRGVGRESAPGRLEGLAERGPGPTRSVWWDWGGTLARRPRSREPGLGRVGPSGSEAIPPLAGHHDAGVREVLPGAASGGGRHTSRSRCVEQSASI